MSDPAVFPYLTAPEDAVSGTVWALEGQDIRRDGTVILPGWDYNTNISAVRTLTVDVARVRSACRLTDDDELLLLIDFHSSATNLRGRSLLVPLDGDTTTVPVDIRVAGPELGGTLTLFTRIVLGTKLPSADILVASRRGSVLWSDEKVVRLEGVAGRFPLEVIDFQNHPPFPPDGAWVLDWDPERLDVPVLGGVRLFINQKNSHVLKAVTAAAPEPVDLLIRSAIYFDVGRTMLRGALQIDEFVDQTDTYLIDSVGRALVRMATLLFPGDSLRSLRSMATDRSGYFDAVLQERFKLFSTD
jgi:hypothetical protein